MTPKCHSFSQHEILGMSLNGGKQPSSTSLVGVRMLISTASGWPAKKKIKKSID